MIWYRVQVGAYIFKKNAEKVCVDLIQKGFKTVMPRENGLYKVRIGSFQDRKKAEKLLTRVRRYKEYEKAKIIAWDDGKKDEKPVSDQSDVYKVKAAMEKYVDSKTAHKDVLADYNKMRTARGKKPLGMDAAWCAMTIVAAFNEAGLLDLIGFGRRSIDLKNNAKSRGTWISGEPDHYELGDIVIYQNSDGQPNHTEFSVDDIWNYAGNNKGGCHKRKKKDRSSKVNGVIRPKYKVVKPSEEEEKQDQEPKKKESKPKIRFVGIWHTESDPSKFGDAEVFIEYAEDGSIANAVLVDTGQNNSDTVKKLKKLGVKILDAVVISHAHGDHYGYLSGILKEFTVRHLYLPNVTELKKYQKPYASAIENQAKKAEKLGIPVVYLTTGSHFKFGHILCECVYQVPADELKEHDAHHFVNNQSIVTVFTLDGIGRVFLSGDLSNPGNKVLMKKVKQSIVESDVAKCAWHGDGNAMTIDFAKYVNATAWFWNYHAKESHGGRGNTRKKLQSAGAKYILRNFEDGDLYFDYYDGKWTINTSKGTYKDKTFESKLHFLT